MSEMSASEKSVGDCSKFKNQNYSLEHGEARPKAFKKGSSRDIKLGLNCQLSLE